MTDQPPISSEKEQEKNPEEDKKTDLKQLADEVDQEIIEEIRRLDEIRVAYEEEFDRKIIHEEVDPSEKTEDHLQIAAHIRNLLDLLFEKPENINQFRKIAKTIFGAFRVTGDKALQMVLPIIEVLDCCEKLTPDEISEFRTSVYQRSSDWLEEEMGFLKNKGKLSIDVLEKVVKDIS